jgi:hypothetical protein
MREMIYAYKMLVGKLEGSLRHRGEDIIKMCLEELRAKGNA